MRALAFLLAFISSAFAYQVLIPNAVQGWTNVGGQPYVSSVKSLLVTLMTSCSLSWARVATDSLNFTVVLDNQVC
jgi:hypothetical protein